MRTALILSTIAIGIVLAGCGGGGGGSSSSPASTSPFAGSYRGLNTFTNTAGDTETSSVDATVGANGSLTGSYLVTGASGSLQGIVGQQGSVAGSISSGGSVTVVSTPNGTTTGSAATGTAAFGSNGHLDISLTYSNGTSSADFVKQ